LSVELESEKATLVAGSLGTVRAAGRWAQGRLVWFARFAQRKPLGAISLLVLVVTVLAAILADVMDIHDPLDNNYLVALQGPSLAHWLGTDDFGRDMYSRIVHGARTTVTVAFLSVAIGTGIGLLLGLVGGYFGGWLDNLIQRLAEVFLAFPGIVLAIAMVSVLGAGMDKVIIALAVSFAPGSARVMRSAVLQVKGLPYVDAARAIGAAPGRIMFHHILPNIMAPYLIIFSTLLGTAILAEASLSFLGLGVPPPAPSWGRMLSGGAQTYALVAPHMVIIPGLAISLVVFAFNLFGDALRDVWDPRLRGR